MSLGPLLSVPGHFLLPSAGSLTPLALPLPKSRTLCKLQNLLNLSLLVCDSERGEGTPASASAWTKTGSRTKWGKATCPGHLSESPQQCPWRAGVTCCSPCSPTPYLVPST